MPAAPRMQQNGDGMPRRDEVEKHRDLGRLDRLDERVAFENGRHLIGCGQSFRQQFGHGHRRLQNQRRMNHVAEIQNPAHCTSRGINEQVAGVTITVNRLGTQSAQCRKPLLHRAEDFHDALPDAGRVDIGGVFDEFGQAADVPRDALSQSRVEETAQCPIDSSQGASDVHQQWRLRRDLRQQPPRDISHEACRVSDAVPLDAAQIRARLRCENSRYRQRRISFRQVAQYADLAVRRLRIGSAVHYLQYIFASIGGANMKIAVTFAR